MTFKKVLIAWLPFAFLTTMLSGLVYLAVQQDLRIGADDPQIQLAEDTAASLAAGGSASSLVSAEKVDMAKSLAPFMIVYDAKGTPIAASVQLHGQIPVLPSGVFGAVNSNGEWQHTWQPEPGVRAAAVVTKVGGGQGGYVLAARSLREVEHRVDALNGQVFIVWFIAMIGIFLAVAITQRERRKRFFFF